jgi:hypothetical protein
MAAALPLILLVRLLNLFPAFWSVLVLPHATLASFSKFLVLASLNMARSQALHICQLVAGFFEPSPVDKDARDYAGESYSKVTRMGAVHPIPVVRHERFQVVRILVCMDNRHYRRFLVARRIAAHRRFPKVGKNGDCGKHKHCDYDGGDGKVDLKCVHAYPDEYQPNHATNEGKQ